MSPAELIGMPTSTPVALAHDMSTTELNRMPTSTWIQSRESTPLSRYIPNWDEQSKNEMVDFFWMEYIRLNIDIEKKRNPSWSPPAFYDIPIESISGVKIETFRLRFSEYELAFFFNVKNADNKNIFHITGGVERDIIRNPANQPSRSYCPDGTVRFTKMRISEAVDKLVMYISSLDFNIKTGMISTMGTTPTLPECFKKLASLGKAKCIEDVECCVCLEPTLTHFRPCNHHVCVACISQLNRMICPMCRADYQEDSSDEEDSD